MLITDPAELGAFVDQGTQMLFRMETLAHYDDGTDGSDFERYMRGEPGPDAERKARWHKVLQADLDRGITTRRVHLVRSPLSDYLKYEFEWGYAYNLAYEDIRILDVAEQPMPAELEGIGDFWVIDGERVAVMYYDEADRYLGFEAATESEARRYLAAEAAAWRAAVPFVSYQASHQTGRRVA
jgi:hypothetical protein